MKQSVASVLEPYEQMEVAKMIAWFWGQSAISEHMKKTFGKELSKQAIDSYKNSNKWKPVIEQFREQYRKEIFQVPLANKRKRLDELQRMYDRYIAEDDIVNARKVLSDCREEMEKRFGDVNFSFTNITNNEYHDMTDEQIMEEKAKTIEDLERIRKLKLLITDDSKRKEK